jgi:hypothetical protein
MRRAGILLLVVITFAEGAGGDDLYPEIRVLIREAETSAVNIRFLANERSPSLWAGGLYARAGYLDDAARAFGKSSHLPYQLWQARVLYGDLAGVDRTLESIADPEKKAGSMTWLAHLLWRMGEPEKARIRLKTAWQTALKIANLEHRKQVVASITQELGYLAEEPPERLSATPKPQKKFDVQDSPIPLFPITTDGFQDLGPKEVADRASVDGEFIKNLYGRMEAGDRDGLLRIADSAETPFQKALGLASIEHILILANQPEQADQYANRIPDVDSATTLAKAEALSAAGAAWLRADDSGRAHMEFEAAIRLVQSVPDLTNGKVLVLISIATAQTKGGAVSSGATSLRLATEMARELPVRPVASSRFINAARIHYRHEAYNKILLAAIRAHDLGAAREVAELWKLLGGATTTGIVHAWLDANRTDEAIAFAREIKNTPERVTMLFTLAEGLLDQAGAPNF